VSLLLTWVTWDVATIVINVGVVVIVDMGDVDVVIIDIGDVGCGRRHHG